MVMWPRGRQPGEALASFFVQNGGTVEFGWKPTWLPLGYLNW